MRKSTSQAPTLFVVINHPPILSIIMSRWNSSSSDVETNSRVPRHASNIVLAWRTSRQVMPTQRNRCVVIFFRSFVMQTVRSSAACVVLTCCSMSDTLLYQCNHFGSISRQFSHSKLVKRSNNHIKCNLQVNHSQNDVTKPKTTVSCHNSNKYNVQTMCIVS